MPDGTITADEWNTAHPIGTRVRYYPIAGEPGFRESRTRSLAWNLGHGQPVVKIEGTAGGVALSHLVVIDQERDQIPAAACDDCATMLEEEANLTTPSGGVVWSGGERQRLLALAQRMRRKGQR